MSPTVQELAMSEVRIERAHADIAGARLQGSERTCPDRLYRHISRQIDQACDAVERTNLDGGVLCPAEVKTFVMQLQHQAGEPAAPPHTTMQAHDELFRLSSVLLGRPEADLDCDLEDEEEQLEDER